ncbi:MAG: ABC transporter substrate-binding protein [Clostridia bacterium]|nr:ABC transporter substrate-binding protein [Clostridia bacterium]
MKPRRRNRALLGVTGLLVALALVLTGCGGGAGGATGSSGTAAPGGTTAPAGGAATPAEIPIGVLLPVTGPGAGLGETLGSGIQMAVDEINAKGGVRGAKLRIIVEDHRAQPGPAQTAMRKLVDVDKVPVVISSYSSATLSILPIAEEKHVTVIQSGAQADSLAGASKYLFNGIPLAATETDGLAEYLVQKRGAKTAVITYLNDDSGRTTRDDFIRSFEKFGGRVVGQEAHEFTQTDFRSQMLKLKGANPDVLFLATHSLPAALLVQQAREVGLTAVIAGTTFATTPELVQSPAANGVIHTSLDFRPPQDFAERYRQRFHKDVTVYAGLYYDAVGILAKAVEKVLEEGKPLTGDSIREAILAIRVFDGVTGRTEFRDDGTCLKPIRVNEIKDGKSVPISS